MNQPDKAVIGGFYDEHGQCHMIEVRLNAAGLTREDVAEAVRTVFQPNGLPVPRRIEQVGGSGYARELGSTDVIPTGRTNVQTSGPQAVVMNGNNSQRR